jgi:hypothetical protein
MNNNKTKVLIIIDRFSAERVQYFSIKAEYPTTTGIKAASKRKSKDGRNSAK